MNVFACARVTLIILITILGTLILAPFQLIAMFIWPALARKLPMIWHKCFLYMLGVQVHVLGKVPQNRPSMIVSNHTSWSDILILGSVMELCFIAKSDVKSWPGINLLAALQRTVFIERERKSKTAEQANTISRRMLTGDVMVLFAEGTTNDGHRVLPFKSALFGSAERALKESGMKSIWIQPAAIAYTHQFGMPLGRFHQSQAAWPGDIPIGSHLLNFIRKGAYDVTVAFSDSVEFTKTSKRRHIASQTFEIVSEMHAQAMAGRLHLGKQ